VLTRIRHYRNLHKTEGRLRALVREFRFGTVSDVLGASGVSSSLTGPGTAEARGTVPTRVARRSMWQ